MLLRSTLIYAPAVLLTRVSALLLLVIATRLIDQDEYGLLTLVVTVGELTDVTVTNWLRISLLRLGGKGEITRGSLLLAAKVLLLTTLIALVVSVAASIAIVPERWQEFALAVSAYLVTASIGKFGLTVLQMQQRHFTYSLLELLRALLQITLPVACILAFHPSFLIVSLATSIGALVAGLAACLLAAKRLVPGPRRFTAGELLALGTPIIVIALVGFGMGHAERILLKVFHNAGAVAVFAAAYALARQPIDMVANAINIGAFPEVVSRFDTSGPDAAAAFLSDLMALMFRLCLPVAAMIVALAGPITTLVLPAGYQADIVPLFPLIAASVIAANVSSFVYGSVVHAHKRPWLLIVPGALGSAVTIGLSLLLIPHVAELGAAVALLGGSVSALAACIAVSHRLTPVPVPVRSIGAAVFVAALTGASAASAASALAYLGPLASLLAGGSAGGLVFLLLSALLHRDETRAAFRKLRARFGRSPN